MIVRPLTADGLVGYDEFNQLMLCSPDGKWKCYKGIADVRRKTCGICNHGWEPNGPSMGDQYRWDLLDDYVHLSCFVRHLGLVDRSEVFWAIVSARIKFRGLVAEPNRYWPKSDPWSARPWFSAELIDHPYQLLVGYRKRVWEVELSPQGGVECGWWEAAQEEFKDEDVTKEFSKKSILLHAWSREKLGGLHQAPRQGRRPQEAGADVKKAIEELPGAEAMTTNDLTPSQTRLLAFVKKSLDERMTFLDQEATPELRDRIEAVVVGRLTSIASELEVEVPKVEAFMPEPGVVSFRFLGPVPHKLHLALWQAGLVETQPTPDHIVLTMEIPAEKKKP